ncbi:hypothetical protein [Methylosinus sp. Sm6]|uniref:hypothetical protein n=1 Tax=Methylosinus sp. Sm6 TaxID=2866948 RepID=UPI001C992477|nr:hypothetical protein [Methylosinus sp. Sm6]MBY6243265.1 hypothetical protein [Methylosinus sp. Sm6]
MNAAAAILFVLQALSLGFVGSAMANVADGPFGVVCVTSDGGDDSGSSPVERRHARPCCVIHCSSAIEIDGGHATVVVLRREPPAVSFWSEFRIDAPADSPELRPLSPRAPPALVA